MTGATPYKFLVAVAAIVSIQCIAVNSYADDSYLLKRVYKAGESEKFRTTLKIESGSEAGSPKAKFDVVILGTETVKEVKDDGSILIETKLDKSTINFGGAERELPGGGQVITTVLDKDGREILDKKRRAPGGPNPTQMLAFTRSLAFPDKPLKSGDEHKFEFKGVDDGKTTDSVKGVMTVVGFEKKGGELPADAVKVKLFVDAVVPGSSGVVDQQIHIDGWQWVEPGTGRIVLATGKVTGFKLPQLGEATVVFKRVRVASASEVKTISRN